MGGTDGKGLTDLKFRIWIQNKPQSIDRTKLPGPSVGSEPGDALIGHLVNSVVLLQGDGGLGRKKQPRNHKWRAQGEVSWARYILDGSKNGLTSHRNRPLESSAVGRKPNSDDGSKYSDELSAEKVSEPWETKAESFKGVEEITEWLQREEVSGLLALRYHPLFYVD